MGVPVGQPRRRGRGRAHRAGRSLSALFERLSVAVYCLPLLAIGPILQIVTTGSSTKIVLAALAVFFTTMVCCVLGLRSADPASLDVVYAAGGGKLRMFSAVRVQAALPSVFVGLRIAAPAALLGAIVGEYLGGSRGLGVAMILSQSSFQVARTWGLAVVIGVTVGLAYAVTGLIARLLVPWAAGERPITVLQLGQSRRGVIATVLTGVASVAILVYRVVGDAALVRPEPVLRQAAARRVAFPHDRQRRPRRGVVGARHHTRRHGGRLRHRFGRLGGGGRRRRSRRRSSTPW